MAGLEQLVQMIYHERQQEGSNLCAQHALNSLLQGNYFTAPDLSEFARKMDALEEYSRYDDATRARTSTNMDDTGFFSVQVLEEALNVWNLSLVRWRSEAMKPYQNEPHNQTAFVLNQNQHWYTLRRFGDLSIPGDGHWFNLDSTKRQPQWISKLYLGMFLQQAESDGYSIFTVTQIDPDAHSQIPHVDADAIASTLPDPTSTSSTPQDDAELGFENEDMELQAALQASLVGSGEVGSSWAMPGSYPPAQARLSASDIRGSSSSSSVRRAMPGIPPNQDPYGNADVDPITASMERDRVLMERMRREQEFGFRQQYEEEAARFGSRQPPYGPQAQGSNEDEHFRRAITDSLAERHARGDIDDDDSEDSDYVPPPEARTQYGMGQQDRVYDDDDANFQAALRASLESAPPEFIPLPIQPLRARQSPPSPHIAATFEDSETDGRSEADTSTIASASEAPEEAVSVEEMRRRRLARFGG